MLPRHHAQRAITLRQVRLAKRPTRILLRTHRRLREQVAVQYGVVALRLSLEIDEKRRHHRQNLRQHFHLLRRRLTMNLCPVYRRVLLQLIDSRHRLPTTTSQWKLSHNSLEDRLHHLQWSRCI